MRAQAVHDAVAFLLEHLPPALHLVIASREDPPAAPATAARPPPALRGAGADLGVSVEEAAALLGAGMGLRLEREQVAALVESLTERELEVLRLLAARRSNAGIAAELVVKQSTVKTRLIYAYSKLVVYSRTQAVARTRALRLLD